MPGSVASKPDISIFADPRPRSNIIIIRSLLTATAGPSIHYKRISVTESVWIDLSSLKKAGQTYS